MDTSLVACQMMVRRSASGASTWLSCCSLSSHVTQPNCVKQLLAAAARRGVVALLASSDSPKEEHDDKGIGWAITDSLERPLLTLLFRRSSLAMSMSIRRIPPLRRPSA